MEKSIEMTFEDDVAHKVEIRIDNSTQFKDFDCDLTDPDGQERNVFAQVSNDEIKINGVALSGRAAGLFKEFINQFPD